MPEIAQARAPSRVVTRKHRSETERVRRYKNREDAEGIIGRDKSTSLIRASQERGRDDDGL